MTGAITEILAVQGHKRYPRREISITQQGNLECLERELRGLWSLGESIVLCWAPAPVGMELLMVPHYFLGQFSYSLNDDQPVDRLDALNGAFIRRLIAGKRQMTLEELRGTAHRFGYDPVAVELPVVLSEDPRVLAEVEMVIRRYSISYVESRAVLLFDIVDFSLATPFEQTSQLNSLSYSLNSSCAKLLKQNINLNFARTTTGDGFYVWNRSNDPMSSIALFNLLLLVVADNAVARERASGRTVPVIRAGFHIGSHYEFYQAEGLNPTMFSYIVGDVTIELARMLESAGPGQIFIGDFRTRVPTSDRDGAYLLEVDSIRFIERLRKQLAALKGVRLSNQEVEAIHCYLTGETGMSGGEAIHRFRIVDKHGRSRFAYNVCVNIRTRGERPLLLGRRVHKDLKYRRFKNGEADATFTSA